MNNKVTIKFILKCLFQKDDVTSKIFQIEATPQHHYYKQTILVKEFLKTKFNDIGPLHSMSLNDIDNNRFLYSKDEMTKYTCALWDKLIKEDMKAVTIEDPYNLEEPHSKEELKQYINTHNVMQEPLFSRSDSRLDNTNMADFLHGRCLRFQNFAFSVLKADKSLHAPLCLECMQLPDSVHHKIFECSNFESEERSALLDEIGNLETNFHIPLIFGLLEENMDNELVFISPKESRKLFQRQVKNICCNSSFKDELLTRIDKS